MPQEQSLSVFANNITDANSTGLYYSGTINATAFTVGTVFTANTTRVVIGSTVGIQANGSIGTTGQVLTSNGSSIYWATATTDPTPTAFLLMGA